MTLEELLNAQNFPNGYQLVNGVEMHAANPEYFKIPHQVLKKHVGVGLRQRLREDDAWRDNPSDMFACVRDLMQDAGRRWNEKEEAVVRKELYYPVFERLGFKSTVNRPATSDHTKPDYLLRDASGKNVTAAFVYPWERWLPSPASVNHDEG